MPILFLVSLFAALAYPQWPIDHHLRGTNVVPEISTQDLAFLASNWKANSVRVLDVSLMDTKTHAIDEAHLEKYFRAVDQVLANGMFAILGLGTATEDHDGFFGSASYREAYKTLLVRIANRYAKDTRSLAYDLLNEPHDSAAKTQWSAYATELAHAIRAVDTSHTLIVEPPEWGWPAGFEEFKPIDEKDVVYSFHFYGPMDFTHQRGYDSDGKFTGHLKATDEQWKSRKYPGWITDGKTASGTNQKVLWNKEQLKRAVQPAVAFRDRYHVTVWCGEFGVTRWAIGAYGWFRDYVNVMEELGLGWAYYSFREWQAMDIEMSSSIRGEPAPRGETQFTGFLKEVFRRPN